MFAAAQLSTGLLVLMGGAKPGSVTCFSDVWWSLDGVRWVEASADAGFGPRYNLLAVVVDSDDILLLSGTSFTAGTSYGSEVYLSSNGGRSFSLQTASAPWGTGDAPAAAVVLADNTVVVLGGSSRSVYSSVTKGLTWETTTASAPFPRLGIRASVVHDFVASGTGTIIVVGGWNRDSQLNAAGVWRSNDRGASWELVVPSGDLGARSHGFLLPVPVQQHAAAQHTRTALVYIGGTKQEGSSRVFPSLLHVSLDYGATWTAVAGGAPTFPGTRDLFCSVFDDGRLLVVADDSIHVATSTRKWVTQDCSARAPALCRAPPHSLPISVTLPPLRSTSPPTVGPTAAAHVVVVPPTPLIRPVGLPVSVSHASRPRQAVVPFEVMFSSTFFPVADLFPEDVEVSIASGDSTLSQVSPVNVSLQPAVASETNSGTLWNMNISMAPTPTSGLCPIGYTPVTLPSSTASLDSVLCLRVIEAADTWENQQLSCGPFTLASVLTADEVAAAGAIVQRGATTGYWYAYRVGRGLF